MLTIKGLRPTVGHQIWQWINTDLLLGVCFSLLAVHKRKIVLHTEALL